ncbi:hypothetical protein [Thiocystis violacea]|uniref:hypothetical protein n=1 Tax=Thiocystis violacea TaxID=13725 RepID=UPI001904A973|nr:hypothetical protein [Thiocystis violacea]MBK1719692.1 hypothetical protein [Thiocystis violacea]
MKFAAKRTWPEKSSSWEHQGDADAVEAFASEFAKIERLAVDTEFVVMGKDGDDQNIRFFRVASTAPYALVPAESRTGGAMASPAPERTDTSSAAESDPPETDGDPVALPSIQPVISMVFYMGKVAVIATVGIALMAVFISLLKGWLE